MMHRHRMSVVNTLDPGFAGAPAKADGLDNGAVPVIMSISPAGRSGVRKRNLGRSGEYVHGARSDVLGRPGPQLKLDKTRRVWRFRVRVPLERTPPSV